MASARFLHPASRFSLTEQSVLIRDGDLLRSRSGTVLAADEPDCPETRARELVRTWTDAARDRVTVAGESAAWIHLGGTETPDVCTVIVDPQARFRLAGGRRVEIRERRVSDDDIVVHAGVRVLHCLATIEDLATRLCPVSPDHPDAIGVLTGRASTLMLLVALLGAVDRDALEHRLQEFSESSTGRRNREVLHHALRLSARMQRLDASDGGRWAGAGAHGDDTRSAPAGWVA